MVGDAAKCLHLCRRTLLCIDHPPTCDKAGGVPSLDRVVVSKAPPAWESTQLSPFVFLQSMGRRGACTDQTVGRGAGIERERIPHQVHACGD